MKKLFLSLIVVVAGTMSSYAQTDLVATLSHGSTLTNYYGADALSEAYTAAATNDVITLSAGTFNAVNIEKAVTIRGIGIFNEETGATVLSGEFSIIPPEETTIYLEGVRCNGGLEITSTDMSAIANISKCYFDKNIGVNNKICIKFIHCIFASFIASNQYDTNRIDAFFKNCVIGQTYQYSGVSNSSCRYNYENCVIKLNCYTFGAFCSFRNCILYDGQLSADATATNCIGWYSRDGSPFDNIVDGNNTALTETEKDELFKEGVLNIGYSKRYFLTETAAVTYLGDDGTQVGIYGGTNPFDPTPTNTQISKFTVSSSTSNGKLSVTINVE